VDEVTAHEVSHQWWGHEVGWTTYHDQWLSEGFAFFSAGLFLQATEKNNQKYVDYWEHAKQAIVEKNQFGRRATDAGPLWLGMRLSTVKNARAYSSLVYRKGGYVLNMLRGLMYDQRTRDKAFIEMMHDFVEQYRNGNASTEDFQRVAEKHMPPAMNAMRDGTLNWFFKQWVYGTAIPRYKFDYTVSNEADGKFLFRGSLTQSDVPGDFIGMVPLYADFDGTIVRLGVITVVGDSTADNLQVRLPKKPRKVAINLFRDVLEQ
jgi:aminopeptidase N